MWKRLDETKLDNLGNGLPEDKFVDNDIIRRAYGPEGKIWPRIVISATKGHEDIIENYSPLQGVRVSFSYKENPNEWWDDNFDLPVELLTEVSDLVLEADKHIKTAQYLHNVLENTINREMDILKQQCIDAGLWDEEE